MVRASGTAARPRGSSRCTSCPSAAGRWPSAAWPRRPGSRAAGCAPSGCRESRRCGPAGDRDATAPRSSAQPHALVASRWSARPPGPSTCPQPPAGGQHPPRRKLRRCIKTPHACEPTTPPSCHRRGRRGRRSGPAGSPGGPKAAAEPALPPGALHLLDGQQLGTPSLQGPGGAGELLGHQLRICVAEMPELWRCTSVGKSRGCRPWRWPCPTTRRPGWPNFAEHAPAALRRGDRQHRRIAETFGPCRLTPTTCWSTAWPHRQAGARQARFRATRSANRRWPNGRISSAAARRGMAGAGRCATADRRPRC
jgi:hypothetical protein